jgi:hypothetical protein
MHWPRFLTAGTSLKLDRAFTGYSPTDWAYSLFFAGRHVASFTAPPQITFDAPPVGSVFHVILAPADTQPLNPSGGESLPVTVIERLTALDGEIFDMPRQVVTVFPNIASAVAGDFESPEELILRQLQDALQKRITGGVIENYSIAGRSVSRVSTKELRSMIGSYKAIVWRQRNPGKLSVGGTYSFPCIDRAPFPAGYRWPR